MELKSQLIKTWQVGYGTERQSQGGKPVKITLLVYIIVIKATYCALVSTLEKMEKISQY